MPANSGPSNGPFPAISAVPTTFGGDFAPLVFPAGVSTLNTPVLRHDGLVGIRVWLLQTAGAALITVQVQFGDGNTVANVISWQPLVPAFAIPAGAVASLNDFSLGASLVRLSVTSTGIATVRFRLTGALT